MLIIKITMLVIGVCLGYKLDNDLSKYLANKKIKIAPERNE